MTIVLQLLLSTAIGIRCKDGVVFGVEKLVLSKLYEEGSNKRLFNVDRHVGMVSVQDVFLPWDLTYVVVTSLLSSLVERQLCNFHCNQEKSV